jgi:hypothetical protein
MIQAFVSVVSDRTFTNLALILTEEIVIERILMIRGVSVKEGLTGAVERFQP